MREYRSISAFLASLLAAPVLAAEPPSAKELLEKYGANLDKQTSFIATFEHDGVGYNNLTGSPNKERQPGFGAGEVCYDGRRIAWRQELWGRISPSVSPPTRAEAAYLSDLWDGESRYDYHCKSPKDAGMLYIWKKGAGNDSAGLGSVPTRGLFGYLSDDPGRLDRVLLEQSRSSSVRAKTAKVDGSDCYVIDADTRRGKYTVWIDPKHGYQTARVVVARRGGDLIGYVDGDHVHPQGSADNAVDYVRFLNIDGVWVAVEARQKYKRVYRPGKFYETRGRFRQTSFKLNPDHDALQSFVPHDIREGASVHLSGSHSNYVWRNGKAVLEDGAEAGKGTAQAVATRPSTRAAQTDTRPAARERSTGTTTGQRLQE